MLDAAREYFVELQTWLLGSGGKHEDNQNYNTKKLAAFMIVVWPINTHKKPN
ncbi:unnamed protein product [Prunus armeniaca]|uniref:Uncharacterized protein n=1 Tax=Prunus armeniaca TaxID=36596 RepID=A0A6J5U0X0_PRUAR|nr:unnamed protein product [Prunus armeniaca]CAB4300187.1 unnamed protein product [Prunus armeniaca]